MSRHEYSYYGYGILIDSGYGPLLFSNVTMDGVRALSKYCEPKVQQLVAECNDLDEITNGEFETECGENGIYGLFVNAVYNTEHILLRDAYTDVEHCILYEPNFPWWHRPKEEENLTEEKMNEIFTKYQRILGIPEDKIQKADYYDIVGYC